MDIANFIVTKGKLRDIRYQRPLGCTKTLNIDYLQKENRMNVNLKGVFL